MGKSAQSVAVICVEDRGSGLLPSCARSCSRVLHDQAERDGLGLLSCRRIAGELGGRLGLYPRLRGGTRALLLLPRGVTNTSPRAAFLPMKHQHAPQQLLIVDDEPDLRWVLRGLFERRASRCTKPVTATPRWCT
jgi:hypothetical protein